VHIDERVREALAADTRFKDIRFLAVTDSTNRVAMAQAEEGAPEGLVVVADVQSAGRGRLERSWESQPGDGLLVSVLLRPEGLPLERWHLLTAATALAGQRACERVAAVEADIKWPNDLVLAEEGEEGEEGNIAKLAGILAEASAGALVVGMGLNVHGGPPGAAVLDRAAGRRVSRLDVLEVWLRDLDNRLDRWDRIALDYDRRCATVGRQVSVELAHGERLEGRAEGLDSWGRLILRRPDGAVEVVAAGDVTHLR
jgi:BirA family biotin operon repressor/biotin-[acetyl-CoA-carboxylase] ligase